MAVLPAPYLEGPLATRHRAAGGIEERHSQRGLATGGRSLEGGVGGARRQDAGRGAPGCVIDAVGHLLAFAVRVVGVGGAADVAPPGVAGVNGCCWGIAVDAEGRRIALEVVTGQRRLRPAYKVDPRVIVNEGGVGDGR